MRGCQEQRASGENHQNDFDWNEHGGQIFHTAVVIGAVGVAGQGGSCSLHAVPRDIEQRFYSISAGMGCGCYLAQGIDQSCKGHITERCTESLKHIGKCNFHTWFQNRQIRLQRFAFGRNQRMTPERHS